MLNFRFGFQGVKFESLLQSVMKIDQILGFPIYQVRHLLIALLA